MNSRDTTPHTSSKCLPVAGSSDINDLVDRVSYARNNSWFIEGGAKCSKDTHFSDK